MKVAVLGAGGAGGYFGGRWSQAGLDVTLIARGRHLDAIRAGGLTLRSPLGDATVDVAAVEDPGEIGPVDAVVVATKTWQLPEAAEAIRPLVTPDTVVLGLQNGVEAAATLAEAVGVDRVLAGTCVLISYIEEPGVVRHVGADPTLLFGEPGGGASERTARLAKALDDAPGVTARASAAIEAELWKKFHFFASVAGVGAVARAPMGVLRSVPRVRELLRAAMDEVVAVGRARGVAVGRSTDEALAFVDTLPAEGTSSLQRDIAEGRRSELEALSGAVVRLGEEAGVPTPVHGFLYAALLPQERAARGDVVA